MSGQLGSAAPAADTATTLYTVPADTRATVNIHACNRGAFTAKVRIAITADASPSNKDWIEFNAPVEANGVLQNTAVVMSAGEKIVVQDDTGEVSYRVHGMTKGTV
jgi:uncharacterized protein YlzI (FlbEa/FlbD family)